MRKTGVCGAEDIRVVAVLTGFACRDPADADGGAVKHPGGMVAHGMLGSALVAMVLVTRLPGPAAAYLGESLVFRGPIRPGDTLTTRVEIAERDPETRRLRADCRCANQNGEVGGNARQPRRAFSSARPTRN